MAQPRIFRFIAQALLGLLLLAWLPADGNALESPFLPQVEEALSLADLSDGERDQETFRDRWSDGDEPFPLAVFRSIAGVRGRVFTRGLPDALLILDLLEAWRATGPPALAA